MILLVGNNSNLEVFSRINETNEKIETINSNNADEYSNSKTYVKDEYCIYNNTLYKANQAIDTAEEFTESHWTETTVGTELKSQADSISSLNSSLIINREVPLNGITVAGNNVEYRWINFPDVPGYTVIGFYIMSGNPRITPFVNDTGIGSNGITVVLSNSNSVAQATSENSKVQFVMMKSGPVSFN